MSSGIDCGKLEEVLESIFQIPVDAARLDKWVNGGEFEIVMLGGKEVPTLRNLVRQIDERSSQAAEEEINEAKAEIGALAEKLKAKIDELKAMTASAETLPPDHPATVYYNAGTGEFEFGIPQGRQGVQGERGLAPAIDIIYGGDPSDEALSIIYGGNPALNEPGDRTIVRQVARIGTSAQWATANPVLEDGESGYERTPEGKLLWKTGDGVTHWNDLPYPSILVDRIYRYRGSVATVEDLPANAQEGDVYNITSTGANYAWTGTQWDNLGVVQEIDPAPVKGSGNPVASGGVYAALDKLGTDVSEQGQAISNLQSDVSALEGQFPIPLYQGATDSEAGTAGLVPPATVEEKDKYLKGDGTYGSGLAASVFTPPTESAPGTAGLVPAPEATPLQVQPLRVMGPNAEWNVLRQGSFDVSWDEANSKKIVLGAKYVQPGTSVDAIPYAGDFYCDAWNVPGISEALTGVLIRRDPGTYGMEEESVRSSFEILYDLSFDAIRFRKTTGGFAAGGAYTWSDWDTLLEKSSAAPVPTASDGVGQWQGISVTAASYPLPIKGVWAYYLSGLVSGQGVITEQFIGAKAGGTVIRAGQPQTTAISGLVWRIA